MRIRRKGIQAVLGLFLLFFLPSVGFGSPASILDTSIRLFKKQKFKKSAEVLEEAVKRYPETAVLWFNLGNAYYKLGKCTRAEAAYRRVIQLNSTLREPALLYLSKTYLKVGKLGQAATSLQRLKREDLPAALSQDRDLLKRQIQSEWLERGLDHYRYQRFKKGLSAFNGALGLGSNADAEMMKALTLLRLGESSDAQRVLERLNSRRRSSATASEAQDLLGQIERGVWERTSPYWAFLDVFGGYNSNYYGDGGSEVEVSKAFLSAIFGLGMYQSLPAGQYLSASYRLTFEEIPSETSLRWFQNDVELQWRLQARAWEIFLRPTFSHEFLDHETIMVRPGLGFGTSLAKRRHLFSWSYFYGRNISTNDVYAYLDGNRHASTLQWRLSNSPWRYGVLGLYSKESIGDLILLNGLLPLGNDSIGGKLWGDLELSSRWLLYVSTMYLYRIYATRTQPLGEKRRDHQWSSYGKIQYELSRSWKVFLSALLVRNFSTLGPGSIDDKNYTQVQGMGGVSWDILP